MKLRALRLQTLPKKRNPLQLLFKDFEVQKNDILK